MIGKKPFAIFVAILLLTAPLLCKDKELTVLRSRKSAFINSDCEKNRSCDLKSVEYFVERYRVGIGENNFYYSTRFAAVYETTSVPALENYVFVQFIRGCRYNTELHGGKVETRLDNVISISGKLVSFCFPRWVMDTDEQEDPSYCSVSNQESRHYECIWKKNMTGDFFDESGGSGARYYGTEKPKSPRLYVLDRPSGAFATTATTTGAVNTSMEFKTCIYKAADVPRKISPYKTNFAAPIHCYEWSNIFIYDYGRKIFREPKGAVRQCQEAKKSESLR